MFGRRTRVIEGSDGSPYLTRKTLLDMGRFGRLAIHTIHRADQGVELHDHPWWFWSLVISGWYIEELGGCRKTVVRDWMSLAFRQAAIPHRIDKVSPEPCKTLLWIGPEDGTHRWGFYTGWLSWRSHLNEE